MAAEKFDSSEIATESLVMNLINKRLRALRKKLNRISQMEEWISQGKSLNKEQEEAMRLKPSVVAGIEELERLCQPLSQAVDQEIQIAVEKCRQEFESLNAQGAEEKGAGEDDADAGDDSISAVSDLLCLLYFGNMFDVRTLMMAHDSMVMRMHQRNCCLTFDYIMNNVSGAGDRIREWDLDLIATMRTLLISPPLDPSLSHKDALMMCLERVKLWLANSAQPILPNSTITYSTLREKVNKIITSGYFTTKLEMMSPVKVAALVGSYTPVVVPVHGSMASQVGFSVPMEGSAARSEHEVLQQRRIS